MPSVEQPAQAEAIPPLRSKTNAVVFECWHCQQGIISEYTGEPMMGEYFGHPSLIQVKVQCPNCEQTAIRLTTGWV
jgi:predicted RNA-binding Zn-ribbon protein involved in translation (DUF1610 family)